MHQAPWSPERPLPPPLGLVHWKSEAASSLELPVYHDWTFEKRGLARPLWDLRAHWREEGAEVTALRCSVHVQAGSTATTLRGRVSLVLITQERAFFWTLALAAML